MTDELTAKSRRLTAVLYHLYSGDEVAPSETLPFSLDKDGNAILSDDLLAALNTEKNADLIAWAKDNISELVFR